MQRKFKTYLPIILSIKDKYNGSGNTAENLFLGKVNQEFELVTIGLVKTPSNIYDVAFLQK